MSPFFVHKSNSTTYNAGVLGSSRIDLQNRENMEVVYSEKNPFYATLSVYDFKLVRGKHELSFKCRHTI